MLVLAFNLSQLRKSRTMRVQASRCRGEPETKYWFVLSTSPPRHHPPHIAYESIVHHWPQRSGVLVPWSRSGSCPPHKLASLNVANESFRAYQVEAFWVQRSRPMTCATLQQAYFNRNQNKVQGMKNNSNTSMSGCLCKVLKIRRQDNVSTTEVFFRASLQNNSIYTKLLKFQPQEADYLVRIS